MSKPESDGGLAEIRATIAELEKAGVVDPKQTAKLGDLAQMVSTERNLGAAGADFAIGPMIGSGGDGASPRGSTALARAGRRG